MATKGSSADPSHRLRKLEGRGGKIDHSTKHTGVADGPNSSILCARLGYAFHNRHRDLSLFNLACLHRPYSVHRSIPGPVYQIVSRCHHFFHWWVIVEAKQGTNRSNHSNVRQLR